MAKREFDIIVYGATGYTGRLIAEYLVQQGVTGWAIGSGPESADNEAAEAASLYDKLETTILPLFYGRPAVYAKVMRSAIAVNGSFFNPQRMVSQYLRNAYFSDGSEE